jgi:tRNA (Thr-GGU) A37 N-methylase
MEKARLANIEGWCYLEVEWVDVKDGTALSEIKKFLGVPEDDGTHPAG